MYQLNNSVIFSGKAMKAEELFDQMIETLGITIIDRRSKGSFRKMES